MDLIHVFCSTRQAAPLTSALSSFNARSIVNCHLHLKVHFAEISTAARRNGQISDQLEPVLYRDRAEYLSSLDYLGCHNRSPTG